MAASNAAAQKKKKKGMNGQFFHDVKVEMKNVIWPTKKEMITYTVMVFVTVVIVMAIIAAADGVFSQLFRLLRLIVG